jgi:hypothetical protein
MGPGVRSLRTGFSSALSSLEEVDNVPRRFLRTPRLGDCAPRVSPDHNGKLLKTLDDDAGKVT